MLRISEASAKPLAVCRSAAGLAGALEPGVRLVVGGSTPIAEEALVAPPASQEHHDHRPWGTTKAASSRGGKGQRNRALLAAISRESRGAPEKAWRMALSVYAFIAFIAAAAAKTASTMFW